MSAQFPIGDTLDLQMRAEALAQTKGGDERALLYELARAIRQLDLLRVHIRACVRD